MLSSAALLTLLACAQVITDPIVPPPRPMWETAARKLTKQLPMQYD
jgi:hypothetical protein